MCEFHGGLDCRMIWLFCVGVEVVINFVHGRYNSCDAHCILREEYSCFLVVLY